MFCFYFPLYFMWLFILLLICKKLINGLMHIFCLNFMHFSDCWKGKRSWSFKTAKSNPCDLHTSEIQDLHQHESHVHLFDSSFRGSHWRNLPLWTSQAHGQCSPLINSISFVLSLWGGGPPCKLYITS